MEPDIQRRSGWPIEELEELISSVSAIRCEMAALERQFGPDIANLPEAHRPSAKNLVHYLALRRHDLQPLQEQLASFGLSSLGRAEAHADANLDAVLRALCCMAGRTLTPGEDEYQRGEFHAGRQFLEQNTCALLGPTPEGRSVRIMVTMPSEAASDYTLVRQLLASGMNCMRVNGAHDDETTWARMIGHLRRAERELGRPCTVLIDLPGPKLRTGPTEMAPGVIKISPKRDRLGNVVEMAKIWLTPIDAPESAEHEARTVLTAPAEWLAQLAPGDRLKFFDARGQARSMRITASRGKSRLAESDQTSFLTSDTILQRFRKGVTQVASQCRMEPIPEIPQPIILKPGDVLDLFPSLRADGARLRDEQGRYLQPPAISVTLPEIFSAVRPGENIWFDDGKIGGVIRAASGNKITVEITKARAKGEKLRSDKGINLPDTELSLPALTGSDIALLPFVARHADLVGYSFVSRPSDIHRLQSELDKIGGSELGIILKIETRQAFESLPNLILSALRSSRVGIMIARGDLAVECGYERTGELQEEIMWIAEAAHVPVIWATQVLEHLAKEGQPSRAEISDAAMAERAECVMLNKGPYVIEAVKVLDDVLRRMQRHQAKKSALLRPLTIANNFGQ